MKMKDYKVDHALVQEIQDMIEEAFLLVFNHLLAQGQRPQSEGGAVMFGICVDGEFEMVEFEVIRQISAGSHAANALLKISEMLCKNSIAKRILRYNGVHSLSGLKVRVPTHAFNPEGKGDTPCILAFTGFEDNLDAAEATCYIAAERLGWYIEVKEENARGTNPLLDDIIGALQKDASW